MRILHEFLGGSEILDMDTPEGWSSLIEIAEDERTAEILFATVESRGSTVFSPTTDILSVRQFTAVSDDFEQWNVQQVKDHIVKQMDVHNGRRNGDWMDRVNLHNTGAYAALDDLLRWIERTEWAKSE